MADFKQLCAELLRELEHATHDEYQQDLKDRARAALAQPESQIPKNCWLDDEPGLYPSPCVFDDPDERIDNCVLAQRLRAAGGLKTECKYYRQCAHLNPPSTHKGDA